MSSARSAFVPGKGRSLACTPICNLIRRHLQGRQHALEALIARPGNFGGQHIGAGPGRRAAPLFFQETSNLPPFEEVELDDPQLLSSAASEIYRMRRARDREMPDGVMGEPAWDILLALFAEEPAKLPVSTVCYGSGVPSTTALRWIGVLEAQGLLERTQHTRDARIVLLSLTDQGRLAMERSLNAMLRASRG
jgi:DNA-binding MarR family transcriptional regulator